MRSSILLMLLLAAGCESGDAHLRNGTNGTPSQVAAQNQTSDPSQVNVNRVGTIPQDGENAAVGPASDSPIRPPQP